MFGFIKKLFDENARTLAKYQLIVEQINALEPEIKQLSDKKLSDQTKVFRKRIQDELAQGKTESDILDALLPEAFATVREASRRVTGLRHFDVQLLAGIALHFKTVTEQKTGEGKTLTVTAPLYLNALLGKGAHLVTVNDYLAELGCGWMGPVYNFLGMSTSVIIHDVAKMYNPDIDSEERGDERLEHFETISRTKAYRTDITYGTNNEFGFDYLRDNMVHDLAEMVQRTDTAHYFAIVDEADSILIDEARTPLIISAPDTNPSRRYFEFAQMVTSLEKGTDYNLDEKQRTVTLSDLGIKRIEKKLGVTNLYEESFETIHLIESALKAKTLFIRDKEYIVKDKQVIIVDDHTGRLMYGRRYSDGLHQAIEAKEGVPIQQESRTLATISIQNYFRQYEKLSGMTGTAATEAEEFRNIYNVNVLVVPTHQPIKRDDKVDVVYKTTAAKYSAIADTVEEIHKTGRPILIGTRSIEHNQIISDLLKRKNITHQVLNAKNHEREAFIIADAGKPGAITVATNIAGRGVDIVLGGAKPELKDFRRTKSVTELSATDKAALEEAGLPKSIDPLKYKIAEYAKATTAWKKEHQSVLDVGGLYIIGTERHESRRIDNQLRGRSGRQGDPGTTQFYLSLEDDIMRIFGGEYISKIMNALSIEENEPIEHGLISKAIESAQVKVEGFFFDQRKRLVEFDDVMNKQRTVLYSRRRKIVEFSTAQSDALKELIMQYLKDEVRSIVGLHAPKKISAESLANLLKEFSLVLPLDTASSWRLNEQLVQESKSAADIEATLIKLVETGYSRLEKQLGNPAIKTLEKLVTLNTFDEQWMDHLDSVESLRDGIWLRGDQRTVLSEYKKEAYAMFERLVTRIESTIAQRIFRSQLQQANQQARQLIPQNLHTEKENINESLMKEVADATLPTQLPQNRTGSALDLAAALKNASNTNKKVAPTKKEKVGRNEPCPCGSGLKYKKCGLINAPEHRG